MLHIVPDDPVNSLQAAWMPRLPPIITGTYWSLLCSFHFSSPTPRTTVVISGFRFTSRLVVTECQT